MTVLLRDDMLLETVQRSEPCPPLHAAGAAVYRCAKRNMTVIQTVTTANLPKETVEQIICELVSMKLIAVRPPSEKSSPDADFLSELEQFYKAAQTSDYYELLGVEPETPRGEMRNRYFELSKRFHPDKAYGRVGTEEKDKMKLVFQRLTDAYDVLSNTKRRAEYNTTIAETLELRAIEKKLKAAVEQRHSVPAEPTMPKEGSAPPSGRPSVSTARVSTPVAERASNPPKFVPSVAPNPIDNSRREEMRRRRAGRAVADLLRRRSDNPSPSPGVTAEKQLAEAEAAISEKRFADAASMCKAVLGADAGNARAKALLQRATTEQSKIQAKAHLRRGMYAVREGQIKEAKWHFEQAAAQDRENTEARHLLAEILVQHENDFVSALVLMKEVIVLGGQRARYFATLGDIFLGLKDLERAADAYNKAMRLEPDNKDLKKKLRLCKK